MRTFVEHQRAVRELLAALLASLEAAEGAEALSLHEVSGPHGRVRARGRVLAHDVLAPGDLPAFANSQMDGYAIASADVAGARPEKPVELPVGRTTAAGDPIRTHARGTASPVMTGAALPDGADAIVPPTVAVTVVPDPIDAVVSRVMTPTPTEPATLVLDWNPPPAAAPVTLKSS